MKSIYSLLFTIIDRLSLSSNNYSIYYELLYYYRTEHFELDKTAAVEKSAPTSKGGPGPFQGSSSYPQLLMLAGSSCTKESVISLNH